MSSFSSALGAVLSSMCGPCVRAPRKFISIAWVASMWCVLVLLTVSILVAKHVLRDNATAAFAVLFTAFLCVGMSVAGSLVLKRYLTPIMLGWLLGAVGVVAQLNLVLFAIFAELAQNDAVTGEAMSTSRAAAAFTFILFVIYAVFGFLLWAFRGRLLEELSSSSPPSSPSSGMSGEGAEMYGGPPVKASVTY